MKNHIYTFFAASFLAAPISAMEKRPADKQLTNEVSKKNRAAEAKAQPSYIETLPADIKNMLSEHMEANNSLSRGLNHAADKGDLNNIRFILKHFPQTNVDRTDAEGFTPLIRATIAGHTAMADVLLKSGANPYFRASSGASPLWHCAHWNRPGIAALILEKIIATPADKRIDTIGHHIFGTSNGRTALAEAVVQNHPAMVKILLEAGFDPNGIIDSGNWNIKNNSYLIHAAQMGYLEIVDLLINAGATVNHRNATIVQAFTNDIQAHKADRNALMYATDHGHLHVVRRLLKVPRINITAKNAEGKTALDLAIASTSPNKNKIINLLQNYSNKRNKNEKKN